MRVGSLVKHIPDYYGLGVVVRKRPYGGWAVRFPNANNKIIGPRLKSLSKSNSNIAEFDWTELVYLYVNIVLHDLALKNYKNKSILN